MKGVQFGQFILNFKIMWLVMAIGYYVFLCIVSAVIISSNKDLVGGSVFGLAGILFVGTGALICLVIFLFMAWAVLSSVF